MRSILILILALSVVGCHSVECPGAMCVVDLGDLTPLIDLAPTDAASCGDYLQPCCGNACNNGFACTHAAACNNGPNQFCCTPIVDAAVFDAGCNFDMLHDGFSTSEYWCCLHPELCQDK